MSSPNSASSAAPPTKKRRTSRRQRRSTGGGEVDEEEEIIVDEEDAPVPGPSNNNNPPPCEVLPAIAVLPEVASTPTLSGSCSAPQRPVVSVASDLHQMPVRSLEEFSGLPISNEVNSVTGVVRVTEEGHVDEVATQPLQVQSVQHQQQPNNHNYVHQPQQMQLQENGWQESRLLLTERASFLLNNPRMSDVRFLVGETKTEIFGHKTLLAMGSPVFEAQFYGSVEANVQTIELSDVDPETFVLFLKYLYTDTLDESIDDMKVLQLLRPAKKYLMPHLIEKCSDILMSELKPENVFQVYNYAVFFDLQKLAGACLRFIDRECEAIVQTDEFAMLNSTTLADFLKRDGLNIREDVLFKAVLRWAELECVRKTIEPTDSNIREALGENLRLIRFPTMTSEEFATEVASRNILTAEESRSIFIFLCSSSHNRLNPAVAPEFSVKKRGFHPQQYLVSRFSGEPVSHSLNYRSGEIYTYRINFKADRQIFFKGVNIFSIKCGANAQYVDQRRFNGAVYLYECDVAGDRDLTREKEKARKQFSRDSSLESEYETSSGSRYFPVLFDHEIRIPANQMFTVCAVVSVASSSYHQQPLNTYMGSEEVSEVSVKCAEDLQVNFTFSNCYGEASVGKYTQSQIPEILFSL